MAVISVLFVVIVTIAVIGRVTGESALLVLQNKVLIAGGIGYAVAQVIKVLIYRDWQKLVRPGNMPSAHSALIVAVVMIIGFEKGLVDFLFALALVIAAVIMVEALTSRREIGELAQEINLLKIKKGQILEEVAGHKPAEVITGAVIGIIIAIIVWYCC